MSLIIAPIAPAPAQATGPNATAVNPLNEVSSVGPGETERADGTPPDSTETAVNPATSKRKGSFIYDKEKGLFPMEWPSIEEFYAWLEEEQIDSSIEFSKSTSDTKGGPLWTERRRFVCSRGRSGGESKYEVKHPERERKIPSKKLNCRCNIVIKRYPHTPIVLGHYNPIHDHEVGTPNIQYIRLSRRARERMRTLLMRKVDHREIVRICHF
jgi:hypothetical protein